MAVRLTAELLPAASEHLPKARALLEHSNLPTDGLEQQFPAAFVVAREHAEVVGVAGLERYGDVGLLRSVVVAPPYRGAGLGRLLVQNRLQAAASAGLVRVFLLTTTAAPYFRTLGFVVTERAGVSLALAASAEFAHACPASATCLVRNV
jgi:amino-acid N-acetyltransferase